MHSYLRSYLVALLAGNRRASMLGRKRRLRQKWLQTLHPTTLACVLRSGALVPQCW